MSFPVGGDLIVFFEAVKEVVGIFFIVVLYAKVVNADAEFSASCCMSPHSKGANDRYIVVFGEFFFLQTQMLIYLILVSFLLIQFILFFCQFFVHHLRQFILEILLGQIRLVCVDCVVKLHTAFL